MANSLALYGNAIENVNKGKWPYEFGLYKYDAEKGGVPFRVVIVVVVAVSVCVFGALMLAYFLTYEARDDDFEIMAIAFNDTREPAPTFELLDDNVFSGNDDSGNDSSNNVTSLIKDDKIAEKWTLEDTLDDIRNNESPSPFIRRHRGRPPTEFSTTTTKPTYPQLTNYKSPYAPKNIQDILGYMSPSSPHSTSDPFAKQKPTQLHPYFVKIQNEIRRNPAKRSKYEEQEDDPFFSYKPREPGDVNLLATASLRFSPPAWSSFREPTTTKSPSTAMSEFTRPGNKENRKPLMLTLNIYPMENELAASNHFPVTEPIGSGHARPHAEREEKKLKKRDKPNKMIIHLNLYTNPLGSAEGGRRNDRGVVRS